MNHIIFANHYSSPGLVKELASSLSSVYPMFRDIVFVCIGTDRSTGDSYGPFVGTFLKKQNLTRCTVYGTIDEPVHALNLEETLSHIERVHMNPFIIGIDASLGGSKEIGYISFKKGSVQPGAAMNKKLPSVGDVHITGVVNINSALSFFTLQNTRLSTILKLAEVTVEAITHSLSIQRKQFESKWTYVTKNR